MLCRAFVDDAHERELEVIMCGHFEEALAITWLETTSDRLSLSLIDR